MICISGHVQMSSFRWGSGRTMAPIPSQSLWFSRCRSFVLGVDTIRSTKDWGEWWALVQRCWISFRKHPCCSWFVYYFAGMVFDCKIEMKMESTRDNSENHEATSCKDNKDRNQITLSSIYETLWNCLRSSSVTINHSRITLKKKTYFWSKTAAIETTF